MFVLLHIKLRRASWSFVQLSWRDIFSNVGRAGVGDCWAFHTQIRLKDLAEVLFAELADLGPRDVVAMVLQVEEELLFQWCKVSEDGGVWILAAGLDGLASVDEA